MTIQQVPTYKKISIEFKHYRRDVRHVWEVYCFMMQYIPEITKLIKKKELDIWKFPEISTKNTEIRGISEIGGMAHHIIHKANPRRAIIDAVALFEGFCSKIASIIYKDYPNILIGSENDIQHTHEEKVLKTLINSDSKEEALEKIAEEKIRSIFYGNPVDFFLKDKARLGFGKYFRENLGDEIEQYRELVARRNIYIHNNGRVDRKYLREVTNSTFQHNNIAKIDDEYLSSSILLLQDLGCVVAYLVCQNKYNHPPTRGTIKKSWDYLWLRKS